MKVSTASSLDDVDADDWNRLELANSPFLKYEFLHALEVHDCLGPWGWEPAYPLVHEDGKLLGASPTYVKHNSYGEFVFDWAWADAYQRHGLAYYPKLVTAVPYTPAAGPRLLTLAGAPQDSVRQHLIDTCLALTDKEGYSGAHWLFCNNEDFGQLCSRNLMTRRDHQFHWQNRDYASFDHFLQQLSSKKRKNIRRERRKVSEAGIETVARTGTELSEEDWHHLYNFYQLTFMRKSGAPTLTPDFFRAVADDLLVFFGIHERRTVAAAICFRNDNCLYGRHWGCYEDYDSLHFELCYYAGIEYCIENRLARFEPGAQGEHKISRGFLPTVTRSAHWIAHEAFRQAIAEHLEHEDRAIADYGKLLQDASPFRKTNE